ncbi:MAG: MoaD/ThiS family protein [Chloroflexi bacterium]|nr:MoaD/ThiS family protein [Chloroflexota bacterium]
MSIRVRVPTPLRNVTGGLADLEATAPTVLACFGELETQFPGFSDRVLEENGEVRRFVNVFVNGEDIRFLDGLNTALKSGDELSIVPAMAGG